MRAGAVRPILSHRRLARAAFAGALGVGLLAACTPGAAGAASTSTAHPLVVYSSEGYDAVVAQYFRKQTGIPVQLVTKKLGTLTAHVQATKSHPQWGVFWVDGPMAMAMLDGQHLLVRNLRPTASLNALGLAAVPKDRSFVPTGVTLTGAVLYTKNVVTDPPTTWLQLLGPEWKGDIGMTTPKMVGTVYPFIAGMITQVAGTNGVTKGERYFSQLKANGLHVYTTTGQTIQALTKGPIKLALVQSSAAVGAQHTNPNLAVAYLPSVTALPSSIAVDAKASKQMKAEAQKFINFVLSPTGQKAMQAGTKEADSNYYPVTTGTSRFPQSRRCPRSRCATSHRTCGRHARRPSPPGSSSTSPSEPPGVKGSDLLRQASGDAAQGPRGPRLHGAGSDLVRPTMAVHTVPPQSHLPGARSLERPEGAQSTGHR